MHHCDESYSFSSVEHAYVFSHFLENCLMCFLFLQKIELDALFLALPRRQRSCCFRRRRREQRQYTYKE
jgi:hypothetical protein